MHSTTPRSVTVGDNRVSGVVLAGTYPWHRSAFEALRPRPLLPVADTPLIDHVLGWLASGGVPNVTVCGNGSTPSLRRHLDANHKLPLSIGYYEDRSPRGAAGCVKDAATTVAAETFVVTDGTSIPTADLARLLSQHRQRKAAVTVVVHQPDPTIVDKPQLHPTGTYVIEREALASVPATSFQDIKESLIPKLYAAGLRIDVFIVGEVSPRVLNANTYLDLNQWMIHRVYAGLVSRTGATLDQGAQVLADATARIDQSAVFIGPVILGAGVRVCSGATIVGPVSVGAGSIIGSGSVLTRSIVWRHCVVGATSVVDQCLLADGAEVEAGRVLSQTLKASAPARGLWRSAGAKVGFLRSASAIPRAAIF